MCFNIYGYSTVMQAGIEQITDAVNGSISLSSNWSTSAIIILIVVGVNLLLLIAQFMFSLLCGKSENKNYKIRKITDISIDKEAVLYDKLQHLSEFSKGDEHEMLEFLKDLELYLKNNRLFITKKVYDLTQNMLDYYRCIITDFSKKDIQKEQQLMENFQKVYYGQ